MTSTETASKLEIHHPKWPIIELPPEVYDTFDEEQITERILGELEQRGVDSRTVVFSGFEGLDVLKRHSFGDRTRSFAVSRTQMEEASQGGGYSETGKHAPLKYLESEIPFAPAIGVFDISKLVGSHSKQPRQHMEVVGTETLQRDPSFIFWATKDKSSLDTATIAVFKFERSHA